MPPPPIHTTICGKGTGYGAGAGGGVDLWGISREGLPRVGPFDGGLLHSEYINVFYSSIIVFTVVQTSSCLKKPLS